MNFERRSSRYTLDQNGAPFLISEKPDMLAFLSKPRFRVYLNEARGDAELAFRLYRWNIVLSESLLMPFHFVEVGVRNAMSQLLYDRTGANWPMLARDKRHWPKGLNGNPVPALHPKVQMEIEKTREKLAKRKRSLERVTPDCVISQLTFGFWVKLLSSDFKKSLWTGGVRKPVFRHAPEHVDREEAYAALDEIRIMRNRLAHHEIIFTKGPTKVYERIEEVCGWLNPDIAHLIRTTSDFRKVHGGRPT
ncbi:hypothetical protein [Thalassospira xiamenensis]|uniref:hypothetical protein n=1 Tax=Thalassospira xiamenensis TaxID=220697 RepID=UPI00241E9780|nr:hypothetical protein [Thalassospira xiamenensis]